MKIGQNNENLLFLCLFDWARDCHSWTNMTFLYLCSHACFLLPHAMPTLNIFNDYDAWLVCMLDIGIHIVTWDSCLGSSKPQIFVWKYPSFAWKFLSLVIKIAPLHESSHIYIKVCIFSIKVCIFTLKVASWY